MPRDQKSGLGTFAGVFTPSILTILGIILFLRVGYVVGNAGLGNTLLIIAIANVITILTSFSLATIATNLRVKSGGDYYLISRTLGVEFGGALGIVLFAAQAISIAFYTIGFSEAVTTVVGLESAWAAQLVAAGAVLALFVLAWVGADAATTFQYGVMTVLGLALVTFFVGGLGDFDPRLARDNWVVSSDQPFWLLFAIFFPAVTGFTQGVSMSGDLADSSRSLPRGTFAAVGLSIVVYLATAVVFAGAMPASELASDTGAMRRVSILPWLVDAGVIAATLSSALASFLGAPRILQSLARDRVFPVLNPFAAGHGPSENPRRGVLLALVIALVTVALGNLNVIAPLVSMFFLVSYGLLNFATYYEASAGSPSFRPTFRFSHPRIGLAGAIACGAVMLAIDPVAAAVAGAILFGILQYVRRSTTVTRWADSSRSARLRSIRENLHGLSAQPEHPRDWRPVILAFSEQSERRVALLRFAGWIDGRSGFTTAVQILDDETGPATRGRIHEVEEQLRSDIATADVPAFARCVDTDPSASALPTLLRAHGLGTIRANTVLVNRLDDGADDPDRARAFARRLRTALRSECHLVVLDATREEIDALDEAPIDQRRIDVWTERDATGRLCLLLAYLTTRTPDWKDATIRLIATRHGSRRARERLEEQLRTMLEEVRIDAEVVIVDDEPIDAVSGNASLVFLPMRLHGDRAVGPTGRSFAEAGRGLAVVAFCMAAQDLELDAEPEEGEAAEIAAAVDRAEEAEREAEQARERADAAEEELASHGGDEPGDDQLRRKAKKARSEAERATEHARHARAQADEMAPEHRAADEDEDRSERSDSTHP
ncbi:MAG TPA: amino acid permease [Candidatus Krumholzibacteria bacterium]|nr:amino acid permease [Candidatus Krumholzibacteria bacterium]